MWLDGLYFIASNALAGAIAVRLALLMSEGRSWPAVILLSIANFFVVVYSVTLGLGVVHLLTPGFVLAALVIGLAVLGLVRRGRATWPPLTRPEGTAQPGEQRGPRVVRAALLFLLVFALSRWVIQGFYLGTSFKWDDLSYHAVVAAWMLAEQSASLAPFTYQAYYPLNAELLPMWFMLPAGVDGYTSLAGFYWGMLGAAALGVSVFVTTRSVRAVLIVVVLFLSSSRVLAVSHSFSANDLAGAVLVISAVTVALLAELRHLRRASGIVFYSGLLCGLAIGCKVVMAPAALVLAGWWFVMMRRQRTARFALGAVLLFGLAMALGGGYWYGRNLLETGNPLFPAEFAMFPGPLDAATQAKTEASTWLLRGEVPGSAILRLLQWPLPTGLVAVLGLLLGVKLVFGSRSRSVDDGRGATFDRVIALIGLMSVATFPFLPFSATSNRPYRDPLLTPRYLILGFLCCLLLSRHLMTAGGRAGRAAALLMLGAAAYATIGTPEGPKQYLISTVVASGAVLIQLRAPACLLSRRNALIASGLALAVILAGYPTKARRTTEGLFSIKKGGISIGRAWKQVDAIVDPSRVGFFMAEPFEYTQFYPMFGRWLRHTPVPLTNSGTERGHLHEIWRDRYSSWWQEWEESDGGWGRAAIEVSPAAFVSNLRDASVEYVLVTRWSLGTWPQQEGWLESSGEADRIYSDDGSSLWRLKKQ